MYHLLLGNLWNPRNCSHRTTCVSCADVWWVASHEKSPHERKSWRHGRSANSAHDEELRIFVNEFQGVHSLVSFKMKSLDTIRYTNSKGNLFWQFVQEIYSYWVSSPDRVPCKKNRVEMRSRYESYLSTHGGEGSSQQNPLRFHNLHWEHVQYIFEYHIYTMPRKLSHSSFLKFNMFDPQKNPA